MLKRLTSALLLAVLAGGATFVAGSMLKRGAAEAAEPLVEDADLPADDDRDVITLVRPIYLTPAGDGPRIIRVPQPEEHAAIAPEPDDIEPAPPRAMRRPQPQLPESRPRATPRWPAQRSEPAPPPVRPRAVLSAPNPIHDGPTPIRPLPRFSGTPVATGEKFAAPSPIAPAVAPEPAPVDEPMPPASPAEPDAD